LTGEVRREEAAATAVGEEWKEERREKGERE
jgi:hypothetical protein